MKKANKKVKTQKKKKQKEINSIIENKIHEPVFKAIHNPKLNEKQILIHNNYKLTPTSKLYDNIQKLVQLLNKKQSMKKAQIFKVAQYTNFPTFQFQLMNVKPQEQKCCICQFEFEFVADYVKQLENVNQQDILQLKCSHLLHLGCLKNLIGNKQWIKCPVCSSIYGIIIGDQPQGKMIVNYDKFLQCQGYKNGTIIISYQMHSGKKGNIHFPGTHRHAYLPDNQQGRQVLRLLEIAFKRKLIFTIGTSVTTGRQNQIVWNGIHHKTSLHGGSSHFGYPDETYFQRVKLELAAKGIY